MTKAQSSTVVPSIEKQHFQVIYFCSKSNAHTRTMSGGVAVVVCSLLLYGTHNPNTKASEKHNEPTTAGNQRQPTNWYNSNNKESTADIDINETSKILRSGPFSSIQFLLGIGVGIDGFATTIILRLLPLYVCIGWYHTPCGRIFVLQECTAYVPTFCRPRASTDRLMVMIESLMIRWRFID